MRRQHRLQTLNSFVRQKKKLNKFKANKVKESLTHLSKPNPSSFQEFYTTTSSCLTKNTTKTSILKKLPVKNGGQVKDVGSVIVLVSLLSCLIETRLASTSHRSLTKQSSKKYAISINLTTLKTSLKNGQNPSRLWVHLLIMLCAI